MCRYLLFLLTTLATSHTVSALRPANTTICDYYAPHVTGKENTAASQLELMLKITHTFILGNYSTPNVGIKVAGVAGPGTFNGHEVYMLPYFDGGYASTNEGGPHAVAKKFLDDGGAVQLEMDKPASTTHSNQYNLLTHVYQYSGTFCGCSSQGSHEFPKYQGRASMCGVHKYIDLDKYETGFFNRQIILAVASLGFEQPDIDFTNTSLQAVFGNRCSPTATVILADAGPQLQAICSAPDCPLDVNATCAAYPNSGLIEQPTIANASLLGNVEKQNETQAGATAIWPAHCNAARDASGAGVCTTATSTSAASVATSSSSSVAGRTSRIANGFSVAWSIVAAYTGMFHFV